MHPLDWDRAAVLSFIVDGTAWMAEELRDDTLLVDLGFGEDDLMGLAEGLEDEFDVQLAAERVLAWLTVGNVVAAVRGRKAPNGRRGHGGQA